MFDPNNNRKKDIVIQKKVKCLLKRVKKAYEEIEKAYSNVIWNASRVFPVNEFRHYSMWESSIPKGCHWPSIEDIEAGTSHQQVLGLPEDSTVDQARSMCRVLIDLLDPCYNTSKDIAIQKKAEYLLKNVKKACEEIEEAYSDIIWNPSRVFSIDEFGDYSAMEDNIPEGCHWPSIEDIVAGTNEQVLGLPENSAIDQARCMYEILTILFDPDYNEDKDAAIQEKAKYLLEIIKKTYEEIEKASFRGIRAKRRKMKSLN